MKSLTRKLLLTVALTLGACVLWSVLGPAQAHASPECPATPQMWGRNMCQGYFTGQNFSLPGAWTAPVPEGMNVSNTNDFVATVKQYLFTGTHQQNVGAAMAVLTMMQRNGTRYSSTASGITDARATFDAWEARIRAYDAAGRIKWSASYVSPPNRPDSGYVPAIDDVIYGMDGADVIDSIQFLSADKTAVIYSIAKPGFTLYNVSSGLPPTDSSSVSGNGDPSQFSSCEFISGHAFDPAAPNYAVPVTITFSIGGPALQTFAATTGDHLYQVPTPDAVKNSLVPVVVTAVGTAANGTQFLLANSPIAIGPCLVIAPSCVNATTTPAVPDPNAPYSIRATVQYGNATQAAIVAAQPDFRFYIQVRGPDGPTIVYDNQNVSGVARNGNQLTVSVDNVPPTGQAGTYAIGWGVAATYGSVVCGANIPGNSTPPSFSTLNKAYFSVHGADVSVGAALSPATGPTCPVSGPSALNSAASVVGWNVDPANGNYSGAGADYAAYALNHIQEFTTAQGSTAIPREPSGLAFANTGIPPGDLNPSVGLYGGKMGGASCVGNYFAKAPSTVPGGLMSSLPGFPANGNVPNGAHLIYYVDGDLVVDSNVMFSTTYARTGDIPTFAVVVKGNIYIRPGVTQLDGFYIAQASTATDTNGIIYSCAPFDAGTNASNILKKELQESCKTQLTVNGAFLGRQVWLLRTAGSVTTTPAEIFNYVPDVWLTAPFGSGLTTDFSDYDAITSLPPVL